MQKIKNIYKKIKDFIGTVIFVLMLPIVMPVFIEWGVREWEKQIPESWVKSWREFLSNVSLLIGIAAVLLARKYIKGEVWLLSLDLVVVALAICGFIRNLWKSFAFLILPQSIGAYSTKLDIIWNKIDGFLSTLRKDFTKEKTPERQNTINRIDESLFAPVQKMIIQLVKFNVREVMIRIAVLFVSIRFIFIALYFFLTYAGLYHYLYSIKSGAFLVPPGRGAYVDFVGYSLSIMGTSDFGLIAQSNAASLLNMSQGVVSGLLLLIMLPLVFMFYERNVAYSEHSYESDELIKVLRQAGEKGVHADFAKLNIPFDMRIEDVKRQTNSIDSKMQPAEPKKEIKE